MARLTDLDEPDVRVVIVDGQGRFLAEDANGLFFTEQRSGALVFRYRADRVQEQIETLRRTSGIVLVPDPVLPEEVYETCDACKEFFMPHMVFFDGTLFLCADCRNLVRAREQKRQGNSTHPSASM